MRVQSKMEQQTEVQALALAQQTKSAQKALNKSCSGWTQTISLSITSSDC